MSPRERFFLAGLALGLTLGVVMTLLIQHGGL